MKKYMITAVCIFGSCLSAGEWLKTSRDDYINTDDIISVYVENISKEGSQQECFIVQAKMKETHWPYMTSILFGSPEKKDCFDFIKNGFKYYAPTQPSHKDNHHSESVHEN